MANPTAVTKSESSIKASRLWNALRHLKHQLVLQFAPRKNRVYTQFYRFPHQYEALTKRVIPSLRDLTSPDAAPLDIVMFACCSGAEAFSLSYVLQTNFPELKFHIHGFDIVESVIERARNPVFTREEIYQSPFVDDALAARLFEAEGERFRVKAKLAARTSFAVGDLLAEPFISSLGTFDIVLAQNVLFHLPRPAARVAFSHLHRLMKPSAALFINGMDTDMRVALTTQLRLEPLDFLVEEIHEDARVDRGSSWAGAYWGRQPFSRRSPDWLRKYCTIFHKQI